MNLADTFYVIGIICMTLYTVLLITIVIILFYIWKKFTDAQKKIEERLDEFRSLIQHPKETATDIGAAAASGVLHRFADMLRPKESKKE